MATQTTLRVSELRGLNAAELTQKYEALRQELRQLRLKATAAGVERPSQFRQLRRDIARILTILREQPST